MTTDAGRAEQRKAIRTAGCLAVLLLALVNAPSLWQPFDYEDDGNLVYAPGTGSIGQRLAHVAERTSDDFASRGPFRPVYWAYFEVNHYCFGTDPFGWRIGRMLLLFATAHLSIALLTELGIGPWAAAGATLVGLLAPLRGSIWYRLGFGEAIAEPLMLLALYAASRARRAPRPLGWDAVALAGLAFAELTKNVFVAAAPAVALLRVWPYHCSWRESIGRHWRAAALVAFVALAPALHLVAFTRRVERNSEYSLAWPTWQQAAWMTRSAVLACGAEYLGIGAIVALAGVLLTPRARRALTEQRQAVAVGVLLLLGGIAVYLPALGDTRPAGRYTVPAACGGDMLLAVLVVAVPATTASWLRRAVWSLLAVGGVAMAAVHVHFELEFVGRCIALASSTRWLCAEAPVESTLRVAPGALSAGEIVHLRAHLAGNGRSDVAVVEDNATAPTDRVSLFVARLGTPPAGCVPLAQFPHPYGRWQRRVAGARKRGHGLEIRRSLGAAAPALVRAAAAGDTAARGQESVR